jgi:YVTN family beta-propeller protein
MKTQNSKLKTIWNKTQNLFSNKNIYGLCPDSYRDMVYGQVKPLIFLIVLISVFSACKKDNNNPSGKYSNGVLVTNEGVFGNGTGTVSFINRDNKTIENDIFEAVNNRPLGNVVQSLTVIGDKAYIVVNNANKIEIVNADDFEEEGAINGLDFPRFILSVGNYKAYVSQWGTATGEIKVIDLSTNAVTKTIATGTGAEAMLLSGSNVYVTNGGGFSYDSTVAVININSETVTTTISVGTNPNSILKDANGDIWVLCAGKWKPDFSALEIKGSLVKISNNVVTATYNFNSDFSQPADLIINKTGNKLYYSYNGKVYTQDISAGSLQLTEFISRSFYSLGLDPVTEYLYGGDAGNFQSNGKVLRYNSSTGAVIDSFEAGIAPNGFYFR